MSGINDIRRVQTENELSFLFGVLPSKLGLHSSFQSFLNRMHGLNNDSQMVANDSDNDDNLIKAIDMGRRIQGKLDRLEQGDRATLTLYFNDPSTIQKNLIGKKVLEKALLAFDELSELPNGASMPKKDERQISIVLLASLIGMKTNSLYTQLKRARITYRVGRESRVKLAMLKEHFPHHYQVVENARLTGIIE